MKRDNEEQVIKATLKGFSEAWLAGSMDAVMQLWDPSAAEEMTYEPVEHTSPILGRDALRQYFVQAIAGHVMTHTDMLAPVVRFLSGDLAYAICNYRWVSETANGQHSDDITRATCVLRKRAHRWYFLHMHESLGVGG
ncbi:nuclear transport factor 2 family protein [Archangium violaceum]|uniref:YybH family protein n=1 Tax=Archangium violaceum TaxID=83451 RepID=UPI00195050FB|nr:nuclear transport factor 2 family protein [Archangium violaceum]QRN96473.1 nuclear transport factor 2 family protein [Archangium violaceum]